MEEINLAITKLDKEKYINISIYNFEDIMINSYDLWIDDEVSLYCIQELYVYEGKVEEIGDTMNCAKYELERQLISFQQLGRMKVASML